MSIASSVFGALGRRKKAPAPRKLDPAEQRYQAAQPFEAIRQQLMAQGVSATPELMQSYQDQAASEKATASGGAMGKRSFTGAGGFAPSLVLKGGPMAKRSRSGVAPNPMLQRLAQGGVKPSLVGGPMGKRSHTRTSMLQHLLGGMTPPDKPEMPGGSFYQQTLTGGPPSGASPLSRASLMSKYKWNRTAREGTQSYQSPF